MTPQTPPPLALFDLDHTLLDGDGDDLWCRFMIRHGVIGPAMAEANERMGRDYRAGRVGAQAFSDFYAGLLAGRSPADWAPWQDRFLAEEVLPRLPDAARALVESHRAQGHALLLTTASNRVIAARSAAELGFAHWIATDLELVDGRYSGRVQGTPNMRDGKLHRLLAWLQAHGRSPDELDRAWFYSDSINDLPLLSRVGRPVAVNPDAQLQAHAQAHGWPVIDVLGRATAA
ncbi:MAG: HAD family hydrolase [Hydrogenophaga sp.]|uniref:HAD family hydrolase n=1 Tax=Hydrogenophaga crocea TaxID=2716225 RepID=A0A6G8IDY4_9BURK|nr:MULTISPECIES: HAD family hydrolase [Hydrogenophaga]MBL0946433.1 HAD family hydrolase [Hydrogenophaga sp.]QIM51321.1 HAD family hydrolase [Hydrogenophaga crocea]